PYLLHSVTPFRIHHRITSARLLYMDSFRRFFFSPPSPPRDLPSFPTRRSSDLSSRSSAVPYAWLIPIKPRPSTETLRCCVPSVRDRKSTRLNSSHQIISYAVFCLKKKKT